MAKFKTITSSDITTSKSFLNQLVDVIQEDISGSTTRQKYQVFVTGGVGPGVTSSLFHTVHDQDFTLQTANPVFDITVGMFRDYVANGMPAKGTTISTMGTLPDADGTTGKLTFQQNSLMMREKVNLYRQFSQLLLNDAGAQFTAPFSNPASDGTDVINNAMFVCMKRLFARDSIKRETFAMKFYHSASYVPTDGVYTTAPDLSWDVATGGTASGLYTYTDGTTVWVYGYADDGDNLGALGVPVGAATAAHYGWFATVTLPASLPTVVWPLGALADKVSIVSDLSMGITNLNTTSPNAVKIYTDVGSSTSRMSSYAGGVGDIVDASDTNTTVGLMFYDHGIAVYDMEKIMDCTQKVSGTISSVSEETADAAFPGTAPSADGFTVIGALEAAGPTGCNQDATFVPDLMYSGSVDNILDHVASCRLGSGTYSAMTFQNVTNINSSLVFCRATADEFNFSSNTSYTDTDGRIVVIDESEIGQQSSFTFVTSVGLYDSSNQLLAVAKLSRPVEKNSEKDMTFRIRLDF
jgi:hypothetical protein